MSDKFHESLSVERGNITPEEFVKVLTMVGDLAKTYPKELKDLVAKSLENRTSK